MKTQSKRRGFSLAEILVSVAIVAVIAAVVIPSIGGQLNKGDTGRVSQDLISIRGGLEQFLADVRRYPSAMASLQTKPTAASVSDTGANATGQYTASQVARWKGPYLTKDFSSISGVTGFGATMGVLFKVCNNASPSVCTANPPGTRYVSIEVTGLSAAEELEIDVLMDDGVASTGNVQYVGALLRYMALPIQ